MTKLTSMYEGTIKRIVNREGGYREKEIISKPFTIEKATWNAEHKVLEVLSLEVERDGYRKGFQIDLVTRSICG